MKISVLLNTLFFSIVLLIPCYAQDNVATIFNLPEEEKTVALDGIWKFKQGDDLNWAKSDFDDSNWKTISVPGKWTRNGFNGKGVSWYRTRIDVAEHMRKSKNWALSTGWMISAAEIYWDGSRLVRYGTVGDSKKNESPGKSDYLFLIPEDKKTTGRHLISIRVSNFHGPSGAIIQVPIFGSYKQLFIRHETRIGWMSILIGLFLLSGILSLALYILNRSHIEFFYVALMSFSESFLIILTKMWGLYEMNFDIRFRLIHFLLIIIPVLLYLGLTIQFDFKNRWLKFIVGGISGLFFLSLVLPPESTISEFLFEIRLRWSQIVYLIGIILIFWAVRKRIMWSGIAALGVFPLAFGNIYALWVLDDNWVHTGFAFFTIMMVIAIAAKIRGDEQEIINSRDVFRRFVPGPILNKIAIKGLGSIKLGGAEETHSTILFADIRGFTTIAEKLSPNETLNFLNAFMQSMQPVINQNEGFINQFVGDEIMAIFHEKDHGDAAVDTAVTMGQVLQDYNKTRVENGQPEIKIGIGVNTGKVIWGTIGSESRMESAVIGDTVNLTSRLESLTKKYQVDIILSESTFQELKNPSDICHRQADIVQVKGKKQPVKIYEIFDNDREPMKSQKLNSIEMYHRGLNHHHKNQWQEAINCFNECLQICPDDQVVLLHLDRCQEYLKNPSLVSQNGITVLKEK